jgi:hypothetical protein
LKHLDISKYICLLLFARHTFYAVNGFCALST